MKKSVLFIFALCTICMSANSQEINENCEHLWNELIAKGYYLKLDSYGLYLNGKEVNKFYPSKKTKNEDELLWFTNDHLYWSGSADGHFMYDYKVDGQYLLISNKRILKDNGKIIQSFPDYSSWLKIEKYILVQGTNIIRDIFTISKEGTYRYFYPFEYHE